MKDFKDLTQLEIESLSLSEFNKYPAEQRRDCGSCKHLSIAVTAWCANNECIEYRGTAMAGCIECKYWEIVK